MAALLGLVLLPGCGGCSSDPGKTPEQLAEEAQLRKEEELKKKKEEKKPDFEFGRVTLQPGTRAVSSINIKPGHWVSATLSAKANHFDFSGILEAGIVDPQGQPIDLDRTPFRITTTRPAVLAKGQEKYLDMTFFVPHVAQKTRLWNSIRGSYAGADVNREDTSFIPMQPHEYFLMVLGRAPQRYGYLNSPTQFTIQAPWQSVYSERSTQRQYHVVLMSTEKKPVLLPADSLTWTSVAYLIWDDVDPALLSTEQQTALLDWLHWGGQLLISGPASLTALKGSFLEPYLPATAKGPTTFDEEALKPLSDLWTLPVKGKPGVKIYVSKPWSGVELQVKPDAQLVPLSAGLLAEKSVGRGRVVVSAIYLSQPELTMRWPGFDGFLNNCLLRRPARKWVNVEGDLHLEWAAGDGRPDNPEHNTRLRYFTRDAGSELDYHTIALGNEEYTTQFNMSHSPFQINPTLTQPDQAEDPGFGSKAIAPLATGGVASWNPFSPASSAARESLRKAAGVKPPQATFVLWVVGLYVLLIVPVNWLVFSVLGKLEWAWVAAPLLAVAFSIGVVRLAQLDIGFVRAQTEVAILELQPGYTRGHLTRYMALYSSLSTKYDLQFDTLDAVAQPFPLSEEFRLRTGQDFSTVDFQRFQEAALKDITVSSNSTGMVQSEQMVTWPAALKLTVSGGEWTVRNGGDETLRDVSVLRRSMTPARVALTPTSSMERAIAATIADTEAAANGDELPVVEGDSAEAESELPLDPHEGLEFGWIGNLPAGESRSFRFAPITNESSPTQRRATSHLSGASDLLACDEMFAMAESSQTFQLGEVRLVGRIDNALAGVRVTPEASQARGVTMVIAHLQYGPEEEPKRDLNSRLDVQTNFETDSNLLDPLPEEPAAVSP